MPLRTRLKRAFTRGSRDGELSKTNSQTFRKDSIHYQPGEKMPPLKYRRPVDPKHKEHLESFEWAKAWRRRSDCSNYSQRSLYSPMGSRLPSRKASATTLGRRSIGGRSIRSSRSVGARSVRNKRTSSRGRDRDRDDDPVDSAIGSSIADEHKEDDHIREWSDEEEDFTIVGLSRNPTQDPRKGSSSNQQQQQRGRAESIKSGSSRPPTSDRINLGGNPQQSQPFTADDLEQALKRSTLDATVEESERSGNGTPSKSIVDVDVDVDADTEIDSRDGDSEPDSPCIPQPRARGGSIIAF